VAYKNASLKANKIWINDGAESMLQTTSEAVYTGGPRRPRTGRLIIFTQADNTGATVETISFNGTTVGGPIDANLGLNASLFDLAAPGMVATNRVAITTGEDWFGWHLAVLAKRKQ
jgi:hypothetical protein